MNKPQAVAPLSEAQLDELADLLDSELTPEDCMDLSMLQGYLTAVLLGPEVNSSGVPSRNAWLLRVSALTLATCRLTR